MKILAAILSYLPGVLAGVVAVEGAIKGAPGATKKAVVMSAIGAAAKAGENIPETHVQAISGMIDTIVTTLNQSGVFTPSTPPPTP